MSRFVLRWGHPRPDEWRAGTLPRVTGEGGGERIVIRCMFVLTQTRNEQVRRNVFLMLPNHKSSYDVMPPGRQYVRTRVFVKRVWQ